MAATSSSISLLSPITTPASSSSSSSSSARFRYFSAVAELQSRYPKGVARFRTWESEFESFRKCFEEIANDFKDPIPAYKNKQSWCCLKGNVDVNKQIQRLFNEVYEIARKDLINKNLKSTEALEEGELSSTVEEHFSCLNALLKKTEQKKAVFMNLACYFSGALTQEEIDKMSPDDPSLSGDSWYSSYTYIFLNDLEDVIDTFSNGYEDNAQPSSSDLIDMDDSTDSPS